ncbi:MAG TPA: hypothetical protein PKK43_17835, partial [Spirochaetota bacterium]|nr:hypothetical protein [Spirochaetota bacterium]
MHSMIRYLIWLCAGTVVSACIAGVIIHAQILTNLPSETAVSVEKQHGEENSDTVYSPDDWEKYVSEPAGKKYTESGRTLPETEYF